MKKVSIFLVLTFALLVLCACNNSNSQTGDNDFSVEPGTVEEESTSPFALDPTKSAEQQAIDESLKEESRIALEKKLNKAYLKDDTVVATVNGVAITMQEKNVLDFQSNGMDYDILSELILREVSLQSLETYGFVIDSKEQSQNYDVDQDFLTVINESDLREMQCSREELAKVRSKSNERREAKSAISRTITNRIVDGVEWEIGDKKLDKEYKKCVEMYSELTQESKFTFKKMGAFNAKEEKFKEHFNEYLLSKADVQILITD